MEKTRQTRLGEFFTSNKTYDEKPKEWTKREIKISKTETKVEYIKLYKDREYVRGKYDPDTEKIVIKDGTYVLLSGKYGKTTVRERKTGKFIGLIDYGSEMNENEKKKKKEKKVKKVKKKEKKEMNDADLGLFGERMLMELFKSHGWDSLVKFQDKYSELDFIDHKKKVVIELKTRRGWFEGETIFGANKIQAFESMKSKWNWKGYSFYIVFFYKDEKQIFAHEYDPNKQYITRNILFKGKSKQHVVLSHSDLQPLTIFRKYIS